MVRRLQLKSGSRCAYAKCNLVKVKIGLLLNSKRNAETSKLNSTSYTVYVTHSDLVIELVNAFPISFIQRGIRLAD